VALVIFVQWRWLFLFSGVSYFCSVALVIFAASLRKGSFKISILENLNKLIIDN
jgi:hypothetical protein